MIYSQQIGCGGNFLDGEVHFHIFKARCEGKMMNGPAQLILMLILEEIKEGG